MVFNSLTLAHPFDPLNQYLDSYISFAFLVKGIPQTNDPCCLSNVLHICQILYTFLT